MGVYRNLKYVYYTLKSYRLCSVISIAGLTLGLSCVFVIAKQIQQEMTTDHFHTAIDRIYCMASKGSLADRSALTGYWTAESLPRDFPAIENATSIRTYQQGDVIYKNRLYHADILAVDPEFGKIFSFPMLAGDLFEALSDPGQAVITEKLAKQIYGHACPVGETLEYWGILYKVAAVVKELPANSSLFFDLLVPTRKEFYTRMASSWITLKPGMEISSVITKNVFFLPFRTLYFDENVDRGIFPTLRVGNMHSLWVLGWIGFAVLIISLFNYVNIYQVALLKRNREVGVKKIFGNTAGRLFLSFWLENLVMVFVSLFFSIFSIVLLSEVLAHHIGLDWEIHWAFDGFVPFLILLLFPLIMAIWPYLKYRKVNPMEAVRCGYSGYTSLWFRKGLLLAQYVMTTLMVVVSLYFIRQLDFMLNRDIGLNRENVIQVSFFNDDQYMIETKRGEEYRNYYTRRWSNIRYVRDELKRNPNVQQVCHGNFPLDTWTFRWKNEQTGTGMVTCATLSVTPEYLPLFGMKLKEGRFFDRRQEYDRVKKVVINETAKKYFGIQNIETACLEAESWGKYEVIGVIEDFHFEHLSKMIQPLIMVFFEDEDKPALMHITRGKEEETLLFLQQLFEKVTPESDFSYRFFDDVVKAQYQEDQHTVKIFSLFTVIAVFISAIGLFGFSVFDMQQRYREVALRKVNGATRWEVIVKLARQYCMLVGISLVVACPLSWFVIHKYMEHFSEKVALTLWLYGIAVLITGTVTFLTLWGQSYRAASENPVKALKNE